MNNAIDMNKPISQCTLQDVAMAVASILQGTAPKSGRVMVKGFQALSVILGCNVKKVSAMYKEGVFESACQTSGERTKLFDKDKALQCYYNYLKH